MPASPAEAAAVRADVAELIAAQPLAHWHQVFADNDCCVTPVLRLDESLQDPQFRARGMVLDAPGGAQLAGPVQMSGHVFEVRRPAPRPGQHSDEVLAEAGYMAAQLVAMRAKGVVG